MIARQIASKYYERDKHQEKIARERYDYLLKFLVSKKDQDGVDFLKSVALSAGRYIEAVVKRIMKTDSLKLEGYSERYVAEEISHLDKIQRIKHNALISDISIFNRYIYTKYLDELKNIQGGIFTLDPERINDRNIIATWAWYLFAGIND